MEEHRKKEGIIQTSSKEVKFSLGNLKRRVIVIEHFI